jgi:hypothetical protein
MEPATRHRVDHDLCDLGRPERTDVAHQVVAVPEVPNERIEDDELLVGGTTVHVDAAQQAADERFDQFRGEGELHRSP